MRYTMLESPSIFDTTIHRTQTPSSFSPARLFKASINMRVITGFKFVFCSMKGHVGTYSASANCKRQVKICKPVAMLLFPCQGGELWH